MAQPWKNHLYYGDNLTILREHIRDESIDLVYLDPPFNSQATYNVLFHARGAHNIRAHVLHNMSTNVVCTPARGPRSNGRKMCGSDRGAKHTFVPGQ